MNTSVVPLQILISTAYMTIHDQRLGRSHVFVADRKRGPGHVPIAWSVCRVFGVLGNVLIIPYHWHIIVGKTTSVGPLQIFHQYKRVRTDEDVSQDGQILQRCTHAFVLVPHPVLQVARLKIR